MSRPRSLGCAWAALLLLLAPVVVAWQPAELPTAQQRLERLDKALLPVVGAINAVVEDFGITPASLGLEDAYLDIIQARAIQGWELVREFGHESCAAQYIATLLVGFAVTADSIDSYRAKDPVYNQEVATGLFLVGPKATLERSATTCGPAEAGPTPQPTAIATPRATPEATP